MLVEWLDVGMFLLVECRRCGHCASVDPRPLAVQRGAACHPELLRWRCTVCDGTRPRVLLDTRGPRFEIDLQPAV